MQFEICQSVPGHQIGAGQKENHATWAREQLMRAVVGVGAAPSRKVCCGSGGWEWGQMTKDKHHLSMFKKQGRVQWAVEVN